MFGYHHTDLPQHNPYAPYIYHSEPTSPELAYLYATSDIALWPAWCESFPLPPLQAMASGTAVVMTRTGTEDYALHEENAVVFDPRDINAMAVQVLRLVGDAELRQRLADAGRQTAKRYAWDRAVAAREHILLAIHRNEVGIDLEAPALSGVTDAHGIPLERAPNDVTESCGLYWEDGRLFLINGGMRRLVSERRAVPELLRRGVAYTDVEQLDIARTPTGAPLTGASDLTRIVGLTNEP